MTVIMISPPQTLNQCSIQRSIGIYRWTEGYIEFRNLTGLGFTTETAAVILPCPKLRALKSLGPGPAFLDLLL